MPTRHLNPLDKTINAFDQALRTVFGSPQGSDRADPAESIAESDMDDAERKRSARLMRVNHCGEVCAQGLYQGQALTAKMESARASMRQASEEENDHLGWTESRIRELGGHTSILNPAFYLGSFAMGALAGKAGDQWSLGFVAETENQVVKHLEDHLEKMPESDSKSHAILEQMREDEARHAENAVNAGGRKLPFPLRLLMKATSKAMTKTTYWV